MHFISDEAYGMSVYDSNRKFQSVLSLYSKLPDPQKTHVIWAFSKVRICFIYDNVITVVVKELVFNEDFKNTHNLLKLSKCNFKNHKCWTLKFSYA